MAKSFLSKRSPAGMAVMTSTIDHLSQDLHLIEEQYGRESLEAAEPLLILGGADYIIEDYEKAGGKLVRYIEIVKAKLGPDTLEALHGLGTLAEIYFFLNRIPEALSLINEAKSNSKKIDPCAYDPMLEALLRRAGAHKEKTDLRSRQRGFVAALMALSLCITRGWHRGSGGAQILDGLSVIFTSYGMEKEDWEWVVKHAHLTKYDFVGLLSILLHNTGLASEPVVTVVKARRRSNGVRYHYIGPDAGVCETSSSTVVKSSGRVDRPGN
ncbi:MAG: tetratricopeptide repeat protein [Desulfomonilaceae bacterium]